MHLKRGRGLITWQDCKTENQGEKFLQVRFPERLVRISAQCDRDHRLILVCTGSYSGSAGHRVGSAPRLRGGTLSRGSALFLGGRSGPATLPEVLLISPLLDGKVAQLHYLCALTPFPSEAPSAQYTRAYALEKSLQWYSLSPVSLASQWIRHALTLCSSCVCENAPIGLCRDATLDAFGVNWA